MGLRRFSEGGWTYPEVEQGRVWKRIGRALNYSSDVEEQRRRAQERRAAQNRTLLNRSETDRGSASDLVIGPKPDWLSDELYQGQVEVLMSEYRRAQAKGDTFAMDNLRKELAQLGGRNRMGQSQPPGPGARNQPPPPRGPQGPETPQAPQVGIPSLTTENLRNAQQMDPWGERALRDYDTAGDDIPQVTGRDPRLVAAQKALFEAQQEGRGGFKDVLRDAFSGMVGAPSANPILQAGYAMDMMHRGQEARRMERPEFDYNQTAADVAAEQEQRKAVLAAKEDARNRQAGLSGPMARQTMSDSAAMARELARQEDAARAAGVEFDRTKALKEIEHKYRMLEQAARPSGAGSGNAAYDRAVKEAEAAFRGDRRAEAIGKLLQKPDARYNPQRTAELNRQLEAIRQEKYREFGITSAGAAPAPGGGAQEYNFDSKGNLIQ